ncbi:hypothetical protein [Mycolicibacterium canariasense]|uniref:hypothetical protein n=1 Tax=Mycolicibacterium canariasense TaxID=228230 RepID=UPI000A16495D|nr:hypothetical protein [Mycolicibacterium canariasense]MCV7210181.1 hypothetical protein [Mycolicibacterium canariasense]ORU97882.1 hypothetical protein AWB94_29465 [Mycolicibacterium canariasense]
MSADRYPTDYIDDEGWARIHRGHNLDVLALRADLAHALGGDVGDDRPVNIVEHHLWEQPRVKWCERHGDPCGMNGYCPDPGCALQYATAIEWMTMNAVHESLRDDEIFDAADAAEAL